MDKTVYNRLRKIADDGNDPKQNKKDRRWNKFNLFSTVNSSARDSRIFKESEASGIPVKAAGDELIFSNDPLKIQQGFFNAENDPVKRRNLEAQWADTQQARARYGNQAYEPGRIYDVPNAAIFPALSDTKNAVSLAQGAIHGTNTPGNYYPGDFDVRYRIGDGRAHSSLSRFGNRSRLSFITPSRFVLGRLSPYDTLAVLFHELGHNATQGFPVMSTDGYGVAVNPRFPYGDAADGYTNPRNEEERRAADYAARFYPRGADSARPRYTVAKLRQWINNPNQPGTRRSPRAGSPGSYYNSGPELQTAMHRLKTQLASMGYLSSGINPDLSSDKAPEAAYPPLNAAATASGHWIDMDALYAEKGQTRPIDVPRYVLNSESPLYKHPLYSRTSKESDGRSAREFTTYEDVGIINHINRLQYLLDLKKAGKLSSEDADELQYIQHVLPRLIYTSQASGSSRYGDTG